VQSLTIETAAAVETRRLGEMLGHYARGGQVLALHGAQRVEGALAL